MRHLAGHRKHGMADFETSREHAWQKLLEGLIEFSEFGRSDVAVSELGYWAYCRCTGCQI